MRIIVTARQTLTPVYEQILSRLIGILGAISRNPSNPNFDQYIFESISGLMRSFHYITLMPFSYVALGRFIVNGTPATLLIFERLLFGPFTIILQQDIDRTLHVTSLIRL
jgi:exportin-2 (importin alpha re-exporter)